MDGEYDFFVNAKKKKRKKCIQCYSAAYLQYDERTENAE